MAVNKRFIIGLTGPIGSGVTTVSHFLVAKGFHRLSLSAPIKAELLKREKKNANYTISKIPNWRKKLQDIGDEGRVKSLSYWIDLALKDLPKTAVNIVIDTIRNEGEVEGLRSRYTNTFLVAVIADRETRWNRVKKIYTGDQAEFDRDDERDSEDKDDRPYGQQVGRCVSEADYVFLNEKELGSSDRRIAEFTSVLYKDIEIMQGKPGGRSPFPVEVYMAQAYALSFRSKCLKRYVGAVIVGRNGLPVSSGFNENPLRMRPCVEEFGYCFKDDIMHKELEELPHVFCPNCGQKNSELKKPWRCSKPSCGENLKIRLYPSRNMEKCTALHAEDRAIRGLPGGKAIGATMYQTTFPCLQCARYIVDAGIKNVVFVEAYPVKESAYYLKINNVAVYPFNGFKARAFNLIFKPMS